VGNERADEAAVAARKADEVTTSSKKKAG